MLMLGVSEGDYIMIGDSIKVRVVKTGNVFRLGIDAPRELEIARKRQYEEKTGVQEAAYPKSQYGERHPARR